MSDNDETSQVTNEPVEQSSEPAPQVDPAMAAGEAAARNYEPTPTPVQGKSYSADETAKMIESATSKAVNEALSKRDAEFQKQQAEGKVMTHEEFKVKIAEERERTSAAVKAQEAFINEVSGLGILPGSDEYKQLTQTFNDKLAAGAIQPGALADPDMVKALAFASGALKAEQPKEPSYIDLTNHNRFDGMDEADIPAYAKTDLAVDKAIQDALRANGMG